LDGGFKRGLQDLQTAPHSIEISGTIELGSIDQGEDAVNNFSTIVYNSYQ
jgi:hypothetical protein